MTTIEWTDETWNPVVGCSRVSRGCEHCYAEGVAHRGMSPQHRGLTVLGKKGPRWTGEVRFLPAKLHEPLSWKKPAHVFVNSMSDLFHEALPFESIAAIFGVMAACPRHTFQVLTKRPERARDFMRWIVEQDRGLDATPGLLHANAAALAAEAEHHPKGFGGPLHCGPGVADPSGPWPLPNVWLGVSVEDQATADERIPVLLDTPAAVRWVSYEPALGPVDFERHLSGGRTVEEWRARALSGVDPYGVRPSYPRLDWIVVGGESGPGARPFDLAWARSTIDACRAAGVPVFVKQLGAQPYDSAIPAVLHTRFVRLNDRKGGDMAEWPEDLRVREMPEVRDATE